MAPVKALEVLKAELPAGRPIILACSGGMDSMVMLHCALGIWPTEQLVVATVDHGLHSEASAQADFVAGKAQACGVLFRVGIADRAAIEAGGGIEDGARQERIRLLEAMAQELGAACIVTAHHRNDQAETVLMRLAEGTGLRGVRGIPAIRDLWRRPMLRVSKADIATYARACNVEWVEDPTNADESFSRNRVRHSLSPVLDETFGPSWSSGFSRSADALGDVHAALDHFIRDAELLLPEVGQEPLRISRSRCKGMRERVLRAVVHHVVSRWAHRKTSGVGRLEAVHVEAMVSLLTGGHEGQGIDLPGSARAWIEADCLNVGRRVEVAEPAPELSIPGLGIYDWGAWQVTIMADDGAATGELLDMTENGFPLVIRSAVQGERYQQRGQQGGKRLSRMLIDAKLPRRFRAGLPILCWGGIALWVATFRARNTVEATEGAHLVRVRVSRYPAGFPGDGSRH